MAFGSERDIIAAIATPPGRGGVGVVRVSGRRLESVIAGILGEQAPPLVPRRASHRRFLAADGSTIDQGLALLFPAPHSYTGETVLELQGHGGPVVLRLLLDRCLEAGAGAGARLADPGEFTLRAFMHGRLDLAQAEAVADLIDAGSAAAARGAARSLEGGLSHRARELATDLTQLRALIEACLDFPDEEIEFIQAADALGQLRQIRARLQDLLQRAQQGALLRDGVQLVIAGEPNAGKSSLLNALAQRDIAIVSDHAGTTRDRIEARVEIDGVVFNVVDTAGLRTTEDPVERLGIERTHLAITSADVVLELIDDASPDRHASVDYVAAQTAAAREAAGARLRVHNKIDLSGHPPGEQGGCFYVSALTGAGLDQLRRGLLRASGWSGSDAAGDVFLARARHLTALHSADAHLSQADWYTGDPASLTAHLELFAENLRLAAISLDSISGAATADDLLGLIFSRFCIGK